MPTGPIELFDGLVKGLIFVIYDFVRLMLLGLFLPFLRRTRKVWPLALAINKRLSSLSYLAILIFITMTSFSDTLSTVALNYMGLQKDLGTQVPAMIIAAFLVTLLSDLVARGGALMVRNQIRRRLYEDLARVAIGNIFLGMIIVIVIAEVTVYRNPGPLSFLGMPLFEFEYLSRPTGWFNYSYLVLLLSGGTLAVITVKALAIRGVKRKVFVGLVVLLIAPPFFLNAVLEVFVVIMTSSWLAPNRPSLVQQFMRCGYSSGHIRMTGLLKLENADMLAVSPHQFAILLGANLKETDDMTVTVPVLPDNPTSGPVDQKIPVTAEPTAPSSGQPASNDTDPSLSTLAFSLYRYLGRGDEGQPPIVLSGGRFTPVNIIATFKPVAGGLSVAPKGGTFDCELTLFKNLSDDSQPVDYIRN